MLGSDGTLRHTLRPSSLAAAVAVGTMVWLTAGIAVLLVELLSASLRRTAEAMDEARRTATGQGSAGLDSR